VGKTAHGRSSKVIQVSEKEADGRLGLVNELLSAYMEGDLTTSEALNKIHRVVEGRCGSCGKPVATWSALESGSGRCTECQP